MFAAFVALSLAAPPADEPKLSEAAQKELKKLDGKWKVTKEVTAGGEREKPAIGRGGDVAVEFKDRKLTLTGQDTFELEVSALDPTTDPKSLDLKSPVDQGPIPKGALIEGIFKLDGDTLTLVFNAGEEKKMRPSNFDPPTEKDVGIWVLKRVKE
jgi:uncharacterized protein (TIGR03067 family)